MIPALVFALTLPYVNHAETPQAAALGTLLPRTGVTVVRTNIEGKYATVLTHGAIMEGHAVKGALLLEHFSFGWQTLALLDYCHFGKGFPARDRARLMQGMPEATGDDDCDWPGDSGPQADIDAVRLLMRGPLIPYVAVRGDFAIGGWYGGGGGEALYRKRNGAWVRIGGGGGAMDTHDMRALGVPSADLCAFGAMGASCRP